MSSQKETAGCEPAAEVNQQKYDATEAQSFQDDNHLLSAALSYAAQSKAVFPLRPRGKTPLTEHGFKDASTDPAVISAWWQVWPQANIGLPAGAINGFWVLDVDGDDGEASLKALENIHDALPQSIEVITGRGRHIYFQMPQHGEISNSAGRIGKGLDIRVDGGYVVAPPSIHERGKAYAYSVDSAETLAPAPNWLMTLLQSSQRKGGENDSAHWQDFVDGATEGKRNDSLASTTGKLLRAGIAPATALEMCRALNSRCSPPLPDAEVVRTVRSITKIEENRQKSENNDSEMEIICMDSVEMQPISWLWPYRIARGKLTLIAGDPGLGKSQMTAYLAAVVSTGGGWHDTGEVSDKGSVIFLSAEDDPADTIKPRLVAAGADVRLCHVIDAIKTKDHEGKKGIRTFDLTRDIERLGEAIKKMGDVRLVIIDPISAYLGKTDSNNNADMRGLLTPLAEMAMRHDAAIVLLTHLNKQTTQDAIGRVIGSIGMIAACRAGYMVTKDKAIPEKRYFIPIKNNIGNDKDGFSFHIDGVTLPEGIETSKVCLHEGTVEAQKILYPEPEEKPTATTGATDFLQELLSEKQMLIKDILEEAEGAGYSKAAVQRAAGRLKVKRKKLGMDGGWEWSLPKKTGGTEED